MDDEPVDTEGTLSRGRSLAIRNLCRGLIVIEVVATVVGATMNFVRPEIALAPLMNGAPDAAAGAVMTQASAAWVALAGVLLATLALRPGDARVLRLMLTPLLLGDVVHIGALAWMVDAHGSWTGGALGMLAGIVALLVYRAGIVARPQWLLGS